jgi:YidC/Oxa1 family membrane protein insertase
VDRRFLLFIVLSFLLLTLNTLWNAKNMPPRQPAGQGAAADAEGANDAAGDEDLVAADDPAADDAEVEAADEPQGDAEPHADAPPLESEPDVPAQFVTLGSVDPESPYRMLATLTNEGAAVRRIELSSPRYLDDHDRSGYLGHLELSADGGAGLIVQAVGAGTPAAVAGLQSPEFSDDGTIVADRLIEAGVDALAPLTKLSDFTELVAKTKRNQTLKLVVERDGQRRTLEVKLARRPLEVIRPESENIALRGVAVPEDWVDPMSFLFTFQQVDEDAIAPKKTEVKGVDLLKSTWRVVEKSENAVTFERRLPQRGLTVTKKYGLAKLDDAAKSNPDEPAYHLTLTVTIANDAGAEGAREVVYRLDGANGLPIEGWWFAVKASRTWSAAGIRDVVGRYFTQSPAQIGAPLIAKGEASAFESGSMAYMAGDAQYFAAALIPKKDDPADTWIEVARPTLATPSPNPRREASGKYANTTARLFSEPISLAPGASITHAYTIFAGPKRPDLLANYQSAGDRAYTLSDLVYYGWFSAVARAMVGLLHWFYGIVGNYGIAIVMLTVLVRGCMFPISRGQARSMVRLQELRPEMERIKEKYKGDQQKQARAMQDLYRKHNVNPLAGCLPMLIQLPVFLGLYRGLAVDIELRQASLFGDSVRWCSNLAAPDMFYDWSWFMPSFLAGGDAWLGPYLNILPLVTIALFLWQQHMFMPEPTNEQAAMQQKIMKYMMIFMGLLFYKVPSGLCLYFIASSLWGIGERKLIPPPTAATSTGATTPAEPSLAKRAATKLVEQARPGKNGHGGGAPRGGKSKRR